MLSIIKDPIVNYVKKNNIAALYDHKEQINMHRHYGIVKDDLLIHNLLPTYGLSLIEIAAYYDSYECLTFLYDYFQYQPFYVSVHGIPPLFYAIYGNAVECTMFFLGIGVDIDYVLPVNPYTPIFLAAHLQSPTICNLLIQHGVKYPDTSIPEIYMPITPALKNRNYDIIKSIINLRTSGEKINFEEPSLLMKAIQYRMYDCVELLLQNRCNPSFHTIDRKSPLSLACFAKRGDVVNLLIQYGAKRDTLFENKKTFLHLAASTGDPEIISMALSANIDFRAKDEFGKNAAFYVNNVNEPASIECFKLLFGAGIDINQLCNGIHVLNPILARDDVLPDLIKFFMRNGANLDIKMTMGKCTRTLYEVGMIVATPQIKKILENWHNQ